MPAGSTLQVQLLKLLLAASGNPITNIAATAGATKVWASLHTADPAGGSGQDQSEVGLTGYTRIAVDRSTNATTGWTITTNASSAYASASPNSAITFPQLTSTSTGTATHWAVGVSSAGAGQIIGSGTLSPNIQLGQNVTPQVTTGSSVTLT